jgi:hypothetical protein
MLLQSSRDTMILHQSTLNLPERRHGHDPLVILFISSQARQRL